MIVLETLQNLYFLKLFLLIILIVLFTANGDFNTVRHLLRSDSKSFSITSSTLSLIMVSILSRFECITNSSQLPSEEIKN